MFDIYVSDKRYVYVNWLVIVGSKQVPLGVTSALMHH